MTTKDNLEPKDIYLMLMKIIRQRIDIIGDLEKSGNDPFTICEKRGI